MMGIRIEHGDCLDIMRSLIDDGVQVDSVVTDPPYHLTSIVKRFGKGDAAPAQFGTNGACARASRGFMGKEWDGGDIAFRSETWALALQLLKPGGHLLAFAAPRNMGRMQVAIEQAGFDLGTMPTEVRDTILVMMAADTRWNHFLDSLTDERRGAFVTAMTESDPSLLAWVFGTGFPKSHNISKAIDKLLGAERPIVGTERLSNDIRGGALLDVAHGGNRAAFERDITVSATDEARQWEGWGTALKPAFEPIILARKPLSESSIAANVLVHGTGAINLDGCKVQAQDSIAPFGAPRKSSGGIMNSTGEAREAYQQSPLGRFPANVIHDGSAEVIGAFPAAAGQQGIVTGREPSSPFANVYGDMPNRSGRSEPRNDAGSGARFFYSAKADADDRCGSKHPTVKPTDLMAYLCRLVTPPGGTVLDMFAGSGSTGMACLREGFDAILIEREAEYVADIGRRIAHVQGMDTPLFAKGAAE